MKTIPRIFHFVFGLRPQTEPFHFMHYLCIASCIGVNKPDTVMFHYHHLPWGQWWDRIAPQLELKRIEPDKFISSYSYEDDSIGKYRYAHLADISRLEIIIEYGGIYADIDTLFVNKIPDRFFKQKFVMGREKVDWETPAAREVGGSLCNAWMMGEPDAEFAKLWLARTYECFNGSWSGHSTYLPYLLSQEYPELIHVEPERSFFLFDWTGQGINSIFEKPMPNLEGVYSIHLWSHMWWERERIDFSYFNAGKLTPEYVRFSRAAYAELARPFLPEGIVYSRWEYACQQVNAVTEKSKIIWQKRLKKHARSLEKRLRR